MVDLIFIVFRSRMMSLKSDLIKNGFEQRHSQMFKVLKIKEILIRKFLLVPVTFLFFSFIM